MAIKRNDVVEIIANIFPFLESTERHVGEPAEVVAVINDSAFLIRLIDGRHFTVDINCIQEL